MHAHRLIALAAALVASAASFATLQSSAVVDHCSGVREQSSTSDTDTIHCTGDLSISHGSLSSDRKLVLIGTGSISLANLALSAPDIELRAGSISLGSATALTADTVRIDPVQPGSTTPPAFSAAAGATLTLSGGADSHQAPQAQPIVGASNGVLLLQGSLSSGQDQPLSSDGSIAIQQDGDAASTGGGAFAGAELLALLGLCAFVARPPRRYFFARR